MALAVVWSPEAEESFDEIIQYLEARFGDLSVTKFILHVQDVLSEIAKFPFLFEAAHQNDVRKGFVSRQTTLYYRVQNEKIELLSFWNNQHNPQSRFW